MFTWGGGGTNVFWHEFCTITECGRETRKRDTLTSNPNPGLVWTNVLCLCIVQILMYILITRLCIIPNVLKDMICTMTMTICGTRSFGKFVWRGCFYRTPCWIQKSISHPALTGCTLHFFQYRDGVLSLFVLFVSSCVLLLAFILAFNESFFIKHQNCWCFYLIEYSTDLTLHSYNNVRLTMDSCCVLLLLFFFL